MKVQKFCMLIKILMHFLQINFKVCFEKKDLVVVAMASQAAGSKSQTLAIDYFT